jgi:hypothetical protein
MSIETLAPESRGERLPGATPRSAVRLRVVAVIAAAFLVTEGVAQAVTPFIRQDDWAFLLPEGSPGAVPPSYYNVSEGRWLNSGWWWLVGQHGTVTTASLTYAAAYALVVAGIWRLLHRVGVRPRPVVDALLGVSLFASPVWVQLLYWPGALTPSALVAAGAVWLLPRAARSGRWLAAWLVLSGIGSVLTYPPIALVLLVLAVVSLRDAPWRRVLLVVAGWVGGFAAGVAVAYSLNWVVNGHFGIEVAAWRRANPLTSVAALGVNADRWLSAATALWAAQWWLALVAVVAVVLGWRDPVVRPRLQRLLLALLVACGVDAAQTLATGLVTEARGQLWTWLAAVLAVALLLVDRGAPGAAATGARAAPGPTARPGVPRAARVGAALLAVLAVCGVLAWRADIGRHQDTRRQYAAIAEAATAHATGAAPPTVVVYQDPALKDTRSGRLMASTLFMAVRLEQDGRVPRWCVGAECREIAVRSASGPVVDLGRVGGLPGIVGIVVPTPPAWI